ncbi:DUF445 domain-containing protein [Candidatus Binatia bacterium]|nr:DUF445 domain-containing protein [Candidatus Binatia bacterium]
MARRNRVGSISLAVAVVGALASRVALAVGPLAGAAWLHVVAAGFEAAVVGGLADWFAVTALFRHPLGLPIPHTAIIPNRREKIIESIVSMVQNEWLSPDVIGTRLSRIAPSALLLEWLEDPSHVARLGGPMRDLLRALGRTVNEPEVHDLIERTIRHQLHDLPSDQTIARLLARAVKSDSADAIVQSVALSAANLADRPQTAEELEWWIQRSAEKLRESGKRMVPFFLRRQVVQRKIVDAACAYASSELRLAAYDRDHPLRRAALGALARFAERLGAGDPQASMQVARARSALVESMELRPVIVEGLHRLQQQLDHELADPHGPLSTFLDRQLREGIVRVLADPARRETLDHWVRSTAIDLLQKNHHQIGLTVRENLEALETGALVQQIEDRVGNDLQFVRLNGAVVGGLIGLLLALARVLLER